MKKLIDNREIRKIGIFRALQLGDLLCCIPAIRALKRSLPEAEIYLIGLPNAKNFVQRFSHYFSGLTVFPGYPGLPEQEYDPSEIAGFIQEMQKQEFDLVLQMQGNGTLVNQLVELWAAKTMAGFFTEEDYRPDGFFIEYPNFGHEIERHLALMESLGMGHLEKQLEFPLNDADFLAFERLGLGLIQGEYVCIHPGSRGKWRQWPPTHFAALADIAAGQGKKVVITGTNAELDIVAEVKKEMKQDA